MLLDEEREAAEKWRLRLAEPQAPLPGAQMPARAKLRLNAFRFGDEADGDNSPEWLLNPAQEGAVAAASRAHAGPERLRAVAGLLEASPMFEWLPSVESCVKAGVDPRDRHFRAFNRMALADATHCAPTWGSRGQLGRRAAGRIPGWSGRWPRALDLDARGWAAVSE